MPKPLTQERLKEVLHYDPLTGIFTWKTRPLPEKDGPDRSKRNGISSWNSRVAGRRAGSVLYATRHGASSDYLQIWIHGSSYDAHRLAILYMEGSFPIKGMEVDHIDTDGLNNRYSNLRVVTSSQNQMNKPKQANNKSGVTGVSWAKRESKWYACITVDGKQISLGYHKNKEDAIKARKAAELKYFGEYRYSANQKE